MTESWDSDIHIARQELMHSWNKQAHQEMMDRCTPEIEKQMRVILEELCGYNLDEYNKDAIVAFSRKLSEPSGLAWFLTIVHMEKTGEIYINEDADPDAEPR